MEETSGYIHERLRIAGATDKNIFSEEAIQAIHHFARGIPRITNLLCEHALINAFAGQQKPIQKEIIEEVAKEYQLDQNDAGLPEGLSAPSGEAAPMMQSLLQNLANLIDRLGQHETALEPTRERKS